MNTSCAGCTWTRRVGHISLDCALHARLSRLAHNLAIAGALCKSFELGRDLQHALTVGDEATHTSVDFGQRLDEDAFAERQMLYWADEVARIRAR